MKKSNIVLLIGLLVVLASITAASIYVRGVITDGLIKGDGNIIREQRDVSSFKSFKITGKLNVYYTQNSEKMIIVEADSNLLEHINTEIEDEVLKISHNRNVRTRDVKIYVSNEYFENIELNAGSRFITDQPVELDNIGLIARAGSHLNIEGEFGELKLNLIAGSDASLKGKCRDFSVTAKAGSRLKAKDLIADNVDLNGSSGSNLEVHAVKRLSVNGSSGTNIYYHGEPNLESINTSSGATLNKR